MSQKGTGSFEQAILNSSFNPDTGLLQVEQMGYDGTGSRTAQSDVVATKITTSGSTTYIGVAPPGTAQSTAKWRCKKIVDDGAGTVTITWADSGGFTQVATDLTALTYS